MKKNNIIIGSVLLLMVVLLGVTLFLNKDTIEEKQQLNKDAIFAIIVNGEEVATYNMEEISELGETNFKANLKTSGKDPIEYEYTGVLLKNIIADAGIDLGTMKSVTVSAIDGYVVAYTMEKIMAENNIYLTYMREGELLGTKEDGGKGPYEVIVSQDQFSQFWVKFAYSVELKN